MSIKEKIKPFFNGVSNSIVVMIGYIPVAMAFGMTAQSGGLPDWLPVFMSVFMFAGATQFVMLAAIIKGGTLAWTVALCGLMDARHLFFAPSIEKIAPMSIKKRVFGAFGMTDEVFAIACSKGDSVPTQDRIKWYFGLMLGSYFSWCLGTFLGVLMGDWVTKSLPFLTAALPFAFPALFFILLCLNLSRKMALPVIITFSITTAIALTFSSGVGIIVGAVCGMGCYYYLLAKEEAK